MKINYKGNIMNANLSDITSKLDEAMYKLKKIKKEVSSTNTDIENILGVRNTFRDIFGKQHRLEKHIVPNLGDTLDYISTYKLDAYTEKLLNILIEIYNGYNPELLITMENHIRYPDYKVDKSKLQLCKIITVNTVYKGMFNLDAEYIILSQMYNTYNMITILQLLELILHRVRRY